MQCNILRRLLHLCLKSTGCQLHYAQRQPSVATAVAMLKRKRALMVRQHWDLCCAYVRSEAMSAECDAKSQEYGQEDQLVELQGL